jgi:tetratricopeptide (TPR) repeat protein
MVLPVDDRTRGAAICAALVALVALAYHPVLQAGFVNFDDPSYVTANAQLQAGFGASSISWAFALVNRDGHYWHPLTWLSLMLDHELFGLNPLGYHAVNLALHALNVVLLFILLRSMSGRPWPSAMVAALFALHPMNVESVAWVVERKTVLSSLFWMLSLLAYLRYVRRPRPWRYLAVAALLALGLMAKSMLVSLPAVLLLLDFWPLQRVRPNGASDPTGRPLAALIVEKLPLAVISGLSVALSMASVRLSGVPAHHSASAPMTDRIGTALVAYVAYLGKLVWPAGLAVYHPLAEPLPFWQPVASGMLLLAISAVVVRHRVGRPWLPVGWFWFLGVLFPVAGLVRSGIWPFIADRFAYLPFIGLFVALVWSWSELAERLRLPAGATQAVAAVVLVALAVLSNLQARRWHDSVSLFSHALAVTTDNELAHKNLGAALAKEGRYPEALAHVDEALRIRPDSAELVSQAFLRLRLGSLHPAQASCRAALALEPGNERGLFLLGVTGLALHDEAVFQEASARLLELHSPYAPRLLTERQRQPDPWP